MDKKWPVAAKIIMVLSVLGYVRQTMAGFFSFLPPNGPADPINFVVGIAGLVIIRNLYVFKSWARIGFNILLAIGILIGIMTVIGSSRNAYPVPTMVSGILTVIYSIVVLVYFNSTWIKSLFRDEQSDSPLRPLTP